MNYKKDPIHGRLFLTNKNGEHGNTEIGGTRTNAMYLSFGYASLPLLSFREITPRPNITFSVTYCYESIRIRYV